MSYRGDAFGLVGGGAVQKGLGAVAGLAGTAIGGPLGGLAGAALGAVLANTLGGLFGEDPNEAFNRAFWARQLAIDTRYRTYLRRLSPRKRRAALMASSRQRMRMAMRR